MAHAKIEKVVVKPVTSKDIQAMNNSNSSVTIARSGIGLGSAIAVAISWSLNKSILWAFLHGIFSWFYVLYYYITLAP